MKKLKIFITAFALLFTFALSGKAYAATPTDEILNYEIHVSVNDDATLNIDYTIEWKVLDDVKYGPLDWVKVGIPNSNTESITALSDTVSSISTMYESGEYYARVDLDRKYYAGEVVTFEFSINQDYMYEMNVLADGETVYYFIPGWFNDMTVDRLVIYWNTEKALSWSHGAYSEGGNLIWEYSNINGRNEEISVTYSSDAFAFDESKAADYGYADGDDYDYNYDYSYSNNYKSSSDDSEGFAGLVVFGAIIAGIAKLIKKSSSYSSGSGFNSKPKTTKKVTRTLIKYYPTCPGCGAARPEGQEKCEYCGRSFIESEEVVEEKDIQEPSKYSDEGTFRYGDSPNTYVRVHVTHIPVPVTRSSCAHSSCAHSSCACAHSCACACACACAGGGRAGCSTKDFYNTGLKLRQLELKKKAKKK